MFQRHVSREVALKCGLMVQCRQLPFRMETRLSRSSKRTFPARISIRHDRQVDDSRRVFEKLSIPLPRANDIIFPEVCFCPHTLISSAHGNCAKRNSHNTSHNCGNNFIPPVTAGPTSHCVERERERKR